MIDYDELDKRIYRIVRQELSLGGVGVVQSLAGADKLVTYVDRDGDEWFYDRGVLGWRVGGSESYAEGDEADHYGPFTPKRDL